MFLVFFILNNIVILCFTGFHVVCVKIGYSIIAMWKSITCFDDNAYILKSRRLKLNSEAFRWCWHACMCLMVNLNLVEGIVCKKTFCNAMLIAKLSVENRYECFFDQMHIIRVNYMCTIFYNFLTEWSNLALW